MEAAAIVKKIRAEGGIIRKKLAQLADVSPSTVGRIERREMDPTWGTMQKIFAATGYQINGNSVVASGDTSAIRAASAVSEPMLNEAFSLSEPNVEKAMKPWVDDVEATDRQWTDRWRRAGWLAETAGVDGLVAIAVSAGNAGKIARRAGARVPVAVEGGWRSLVARLEDGGIDYAVSGLVATRLDRSDQAVGVPFVYVNDPQRTIDGLKLEIAKPGQGVLLLTALGDELEQSDSEGGIQFVSRSRALLDAFSGPGRDPDKAEDVLRSLFGSVA